MVYKIKDAPLVRPLRYDPAVEHGLNVVAIATDATMNKPSSLPILWYQQKEYWSVPIAASGPSSWPRFKLGTLVSPQHSKKNAPTTVTDVHHDPSYSTVSFDVSRLGIPVEVDVPYFPNWQASGASGPYLVTPNLMVVVPTAHHVVVSYGTTGLDWIGTGATIAGLALTAGLFRPGAPAPASPPAPLSPSRRSEPDQPDGGLPDGGLPDGGLPGGDLPGGDLPGGGLPGGGLPGGDLPDGNLPGGEPREPGALRTRLGGGARAGAVIGTETH
jgi:hypothetical protein